MTRRFDLLVFDWDGTLMDSAHAIVTAIQAACRDLGVPVPDEARARHVLGLGLVDALRHALPDLDEALYPEMVERYRHHYLAHDHELRLFDGIHELLAELARHGYPLAIATGKSRPGLERALAVSGLGSLFDDSRCADECFSKPHPQMLEELMAAFGVSAGRTLMIGDTTHDLQMARNAGVPALAVAYGAHTPEQLDALAPLARFSSVEELRTWLLANA